MSTWYGIAFRLARRLAIGNPNAPMLSNEEQRPTLQSLGSPSDQPAAMRKPRRDKEAPRGTGRQH